MFADDAVTFIEIDGRLRVIRAIRDDSEFPNEPFNEDWRTEEQQVKTTAFFKR